MSHPFPHFHTEGDFQKLEPSAPQNLKRVNWEFNASSGFLSNRLKIIWKEEQELLH